MIIKTIAATYGRKVNLGDYNSLNIEVTAWADLEVTQVLPDDGSGNITEVREDASEAYRQLFLELRTQVREYVLKAKGIKAAQASEPYDPPMNPNE